MRKELFKVIEMDKFEYGLIINALNELRNQCIKEGKTTEFIDEVLIKIFDAPEQKRYFKRKGYIDAR